MRPQRTLFGGWSLGSVAGQMTALVVGALFLAHVLLLGAVLLGRPDLVMGNPANVFVGTVMALVRMIETAPKDERETTLAAAARTLPGLTLLDRGAVQPVVCVVPDDILTWYTLQQLLKDQGEVTIVRLKTEPAAELHLDIALRDGLHIGVPFGADVRKPPLSPLLLLAGSIATTLVTLSIWAARQVTAPLRRFSEAAERFGQALDGAPLPEAGGPLEVRRVSAAFNRMRERIRRLVEDRTRMLTAISHDLRTPLTRLALRVEGMADVDLRADALADLRSMERMLQSGLEFLRGEASDLRREPLDLAALLQTVCDGFIDVGKRVTFDGPNHVGIMGDHDLLTRAATNLVDNAARHGDQVAVRLRQGAAGHLRIEVEDNGVGMTDGTKARAFEPFYRGDEARASSDGGFGLGLSIVRAIVEQHGGTVELVDAAPHGLLARIDLPVCARHPVTPLPAVVPI